MRLLPAFTHNWALAKRDFRWLCAAALCYAIGNGGELVVVSLLVFELTGSTGWVGGAVALYLGPQLLFGPVAGAFADWLPRRALLRTVQLALGINLTLIALLVGFTQISIWQILLISLVSGVLRSTYQPVRLSYTYDLVGREQAVSGLAIIQLSNRIGQGLGALVAGSAMQRLGPEYAYGFLAGLHLIAFVLLGSVHNAGRAMADEERVSLRQTFIDYKEEVRVNRNLLILIIVTATVNLFGFSFHTALPELATGNWGVGAEGLGLLHAARAVGGMLAMGALSLWVTGTRLGSLFLSVHLLVQRLLGRARARADLRRRLRRFGHGGGRGLTERRLESEHDAALCAGPSPGSRHGRVDVRHRFRPGRADRAGSARDLGRSRHGARRQRSGAASLRRRGFRRDAVEERLSNCVFCGYISRNLHHSTMCDS